MNITKNCPIKGEIRVKEGVSKKTNAPYKMTVLVIDTEIYGELEFLLDTRNDRKGIILDLLVNNT